VRRTLGAGARKLLLRTAPGLLLRLRALPGREAGAAGERLARRWFRRRGYRVLADRLKTADAELDLVLVRAGVLVVAEVKTGRAGPRFRPADRHRARAIARQARAARRLARALGLTAIELVLVEVLCAPGRRPRVELRARRRLTP